MRCRPDRVEGSPDALQRIVAGTAEVLASSEGEDTGLQALAEATGAGRLQVLRGFRQVLGVTPREFVQARKVARFTAALERPRQQTEAGLRSPAAKAASPITDAIYEAGFGSSSRLYERSGEALGMTPGAMLHGGAGKVIRYATSDSPFGRMLVAATDLGVCAIFFGPNDAELAVALSRRYARATLVRSETHDGWLADAVDYVASQTTEHPLAASFPLDIRATAFQLRVWKALRAIPRGETRTYSEVARVVGRPEAVRAVGAAIGSNPIGVAIPCHRVIGKDGSMTGYRWGIERKRKLLDAELRARSSSDARAADTLDETQVAPFGAR